MNVKVIFKEIHIKLSSDKKSKQSTELVKSIYLYKCSSPLVASCNRYISEYKEQIDDLCELVKPGKSALRWLFTTKSTKERVSNAYQKLNEIWQGDYGVQTKSLINELANINKIPEVSKDGKIYSTFARIRRPVRKHICFRGHRLIEASDIRCAHFTMLPKIFEMYGVDIPANEMMRWKELTQHGDLYKEAVAGTTVTRAQIKPTFQSFFSLKNEQSYIHGGIDRDSENRQILCRWFSRNFPHIYQALMEWHKYQPVTVKRAANRVESDIMNPICDDLRRIGLHPFRLHDAIYLPEDEAAHIPFDINQRVYDYINDGTSAERVAV